MYIALKIRKEFMRVINELYEKKIIMKKKKLRKSIITNHPILYNFVWTDHQ
jgi:hypothetical protein